MFFCHSVSASRDHESGSVPCTSDERLAVRRFAIAVAVAVLASRSDRAARAPRPDRRATSTAATGRGRRRPAAAAGSPAAPGRRTCTRMNSSMLKPMPIARRSAIRSGAMPPTVAVVHVEVGEHEVGRELKRRWRMPRVARSGLSLPSCSTRPSVLPPSATKSRSPFSNERSSGCDSSMMRSRCGRSRQRDALHRVDQRAVRGVGDVGKREAPVVRIRLEHDARALAPFLEPIRAGADRLPHDVGAGGLDRLARDRHRRSSRRAARAACSRRWSCGSPACTRSGAAGRRSACRSRTWRPACRAASTTGRAPTIRSVNAGSPPPRSFGIERALDRVDVVAGDELARLALERRIVGEADAASAGGSSTSCRRR